LESWESGLKNLTIRRGGSNLDYQTWRDFIDKKNLSPNIDQIVLNSWKRSSELNVDPFAPELSVTNELFESFDKEIILTLADRLSPSMSEMIVERNHVLVISDVNGNIVYRDGALKVLNRIECSGLFPGSNWSEASVGTNAVGTALFEGIPLQVFGREHYQSCHHQLRCTAAPFFSPSGLVMGCVNLTSPLDEDHSKNLELVIGAARFFERILLQTHAKAMRGWPTAILGQLDEDAGALVVVEASGTICGVDTQAQVILGRRTGNIYGRRADEVFDLGSLKLTPPSQCSLSPNKIYVKTRTAPIVVAEVKQLWSPAGLWLGLLLNVMNPDATTSSMSQAARALSERPKRQDLEPAWSFLGDSPGTVKIRSHVKAFAQTTSTVLLTGESGTGKERVARAIHAQGPRWKAPFVAVNCGALTESLIQSELFGYAPGSFTGADRKGRPGVFEQADGGVLFLDEIGELPLRQQVNLLRILEERTVTRVGGNQTIPVNVKVVAATNRDLAFEVERGAFREDLFHRLNVMVIHLPPLRDRPDDILPIAEYHLTRLLSELCLPPLSLGPETKEIFYNHNWPGNVRSLVNALEYACNQYYLVPFSQIGPEHLPSFIWPPTEGSDLAYLTAREKSSDSLSVNAWHSGPNKGEVHPSSAESKINPLAATEKQVILQALVESNYNISKAAKSLGIGRNTFYAKMKKYSINKPSDPHFHSSSIN
jgi:transcriptional regulator of acetoin/glycerol metabolism